MDPDMTLRLMRDYIRRVRDSVQGEGTDPDILRIEADQLAEYADALDQWLSKGGFLPKDWAHGRMKFGTPVPAFEEGT